MNKSYRLGVVLLSLITVAMFSDSQVAIGQRITIGGSNQSNIDEKDDDDDKNNNGNDQQQNNQGGNRSSKSNKSEVQQQVQQFLQRNKNNQNNPNDQNQQGQNSSDQFRRPGQPSSRFPSQQGFPNQFRDGDNSKNSFQLGNWQGGKWQGARKIDNWTQAYGAVSGKPFSSQWYKDHPKAWKFDKGDSNVWVVASVPGLYKWLGWGNVPPQYGVNFGNVQVDFSHFGEWYPLGVYSLMAGPGDQGTRIVQLAIDQHGHIAGNYYDMISDSNYSISGGIKQSSQRVYFSLNKNKYLTFRAHIFQLLQPYGSLTVQLPGGDQQWQFVRLEN